MFWFLFPSLRLLDEQVLLPRLKHLRLWILKMIIIKVQKHKSRFSCCLESLNNMFGLCSVLSEFLLLLEIPPHTHSDVICVHRGDRIAALWWLQMETCRFLRRQATIRSFLLLLCVWMWSHWATERHFLKTLEPLPGCDALHKQEPLDELYFMNLEQQVAKVVFVPPEESLLRGQYIPKVLGHFGRSGSAEQLWLVVQYVHLYTTVSS